MPRWYKGFKRSAVNDAVKDESSKPGAKALARNLVPEGWHQEREIYLRLGDHAGRIYAGLRLRDKLGMKLPTQSTVTLPKPAVVFVCYGNIMRSPMAAEMMKREISARNLPPLLQVHSAGLHAKPGNSAHPLAVAAGREIGIPLAGHRAELLTDHLVEQAGALFAMDFQNAAELLARFPQARDRIYMLGQFRHESGSPIEIPDPFFTGAEGTRQCYQVLQRCVHNLVDELENYAKG